VSAYALFIQDIKPTLKAELAGQPPTMFLSEAGKRWASLGPEGKLKYN